MNNPRLTGPYLTDEMIPVGEEPGRTPQQAEVSEAMIEAVAKAISLARDGFTESPPMPVTDYDRDLARAAIATMQSSSPSGLVERRAITKWLRDNANMAGNGFWRAAASAIDRGEHLVSPTMETGKEEAGRAINRVEYCRVGSCHRHAECMYRPCRASLPDPLPAQTETGNAK